MSAPIAWTLADVGFSHAEALCPTLAHVTLDVQAGRMTALLGPNGAGKSTLLHVLLGVIRSAHGDVTFRGLPIGQWPRATLATIIGVVPQQEVEPLFTVREIVAMGRYPHLGPWRREQARDREAVDAAMRRCGVDRFAARWISTLSGGERQRVRIARALAQEPSVLVLDEPTASLDVRYEMATFELLRELRDDGVTIVLATHNLNLAAQYADNVVLLRAGQVVAHGTPADVLTAERVGDVYEWPVRVEWVRPGVPHLVPRPLDDFCGAAPHLMSGEYLEILR